MVNYAGKGLGILLECEYTYYHDWAAFATWYSIIKNLPDAELVIACKRTEPFYPLFVWPTKVGVKFFQYSQERQVDFKGLKVIKIKPFVMAIRQYDESSLGPASAKSDELTTFIDYSEGCGKFVLSRWIDTLKYPFHDNAVKKFSGDEMTVNELKVLKLWEKMCPLFKGVTYEEL